MAAFGLFRAVLKCNSYDTNLQPLCLVPESPKLLSTRLPLESWREAPRGWKNIYSKEKATWHADIKQNNPNFCGTCARSTLKEKLAQGGLRPFEWVFFTTFLSKKPFPFLLVSIFRTSWGMASNSGSCHDWSHRNVASTWNLEEMLGALHLAKLSSWWIQKNTLYWVFPKIGVPPKSSMFIGFSIINHPFWGTTIFGYTHVGLFVPFACFFAKYSWIDVTLDFRSINGIRLLLR